MCIHMPIYVYIHAYTHAVYIHAYTNVYTHIYMHVYAHVCTHKRAEILGDGQYGACVMRVWITATCPHALKH